ncbi:MAG: GNAT family N-acetyltransferase [Patescibacteria group bacterium]
MLKIRRATKKDLSEIAKINLTCFHGCNDLKEAKKWIICNFLAFPRFQYFVAEKEKKIVGYILWYFKGGWRKKSILELEQVAVEPKFQNQGIGTKLIKESFVKIKKYLQKEKRKLKAILVTTGTKQKAKRIYEKVLKVKPVAKIKRLFRGDEIILIKRYKV